MNALSLSDIAAAAHSVVIHVTLPDLKRMQLERAGTLWAEGLKIGDIAAAIGVPVTTLRGWVTNNRGCFPHRRGNKAPPRQPPADSPAMLEAARLWAGGASADAIAEAVGVGRYKIRGWIAARRDLFPRRIERGHRAAPSPPPDHNPRPLLQQLAPPRPKPAVYLAGLDALMDRRQPAQAAGPATLLGLGPYSCKWPVSGSGAGTLFCGGRIKTGSYCGSHARLAYQERQS